MSFLGEVLEWFGDGDNWSGNFGIPNRMLEHIEYALVATLAAILIALPIGVVLGHLRRFGTLSINVANIGRAVPSFALLVLSFQLFGLDELPFGGPTSAFIPLVALAIPPILINAYTGMAEVDDGVRESARGMGMTGRQSMFRIELPIAFPLIWAGIRVSAVQVVATATLAALIASGGLGRYIVDGIAVRDFAQVFAGALLVAMLAIATEGVFALGNRLITSPGLQTSRAEAQVVPKGF
jgi:osmoprotectant transport system permease protein